MESVIVVSWPFEAPEYESCVNRAAGFDGNSEGAFGELKKYGKLPDFRRSDTFGTRDTSVRREEALKGDRHDEDVYEEILGG